MHIKQDSTYMHIKHATVLVTRVFISYFKIGNISGNWKWQWTMQLIGKQFQWKSKNKDCVQSMFLYAFNFKWQKLTHLSNHLFSSSRNHSNFSLSYPKNSCQPGGQSWNILLTSHDAWNKLHYSLRLETLSLKKWPLFHLVHHHPFAFSSAVVFLFSFILSLCW